MKYSLRSACAVVATAAALLAVPFAGSAQAAASGTLGTWTATPATGSDLLAPRLRTSAGCAADSDGYNAFLTGPVFQEPFLIAFTQDVNFSTTSPFDVQLSDSFKDAATERGVTLTAGEYVVTINCVDTFLGDVKGTFAGSLYFTSPTAYQSTDPNAAQPSATTLTVPAGPVTAGSPVTLKASVAPASATGTVQFKDNGADLGGAVTVTGGAAELTTAALAAGNHQITAVFTSTSAGVSGSTSAASSLVVEAAAVTPTTTALAVNPSGSVQQHTNVTLTATVSPATAAGTVQFTDGGQNLGAAVTVAGGTATVTTSTLTTGEHNFTARFVPANTTLFAGSESAAVPLSVTEFTGGSASQTISTTVASGALTISVDSNSPVVLPTPALTTDASKLTTGGTLNTLTVTDTRAGNIGWNVSGQVSNFSDGNNHAIHAANLGWTPKVLDKSASQDVVAGAKVDPAAAVAPGAPAPVDRGLGISRTLASAAKDKGVGTAHVNATVALEAPTTTVAGTYTATLTITAI